MYSGHDGDESGEHAGGDEILHRRDGHHLEGVDLFGDPHGAELRGESAAHGRRQCEAGDDRRDLAGVEVRRDESGERCGAELVERGISLDADLGAGEEAHRDDDADGSADDGQGATAERDLGEQPIDLAAVVLDGEQHGLEHAEVEQHLRAGVVERRERLFVQSSPVGHGYMPFGGTSWMYRAEMKKLTMNSMTNVMTTDSLTASPTPFGPPLAFMPL